MDYGDGKYPPADPSNPDLVREYMFNPLRKEEMCDHITRSIEGSQSLLTIPFTSTLDTLLPVSEVNNLLFLRSYFDCFHL